MNLNSVSIFGHISGGNGPASLAFLIIFIVCFGAALIALGYIMIDLMVRESREAALETVAAETASAAVASPKAAPIAEPKTAAIASPKAAPIVEPAAATDDEDDDGEDVPEEDLESYRAGRLTYDKSFLAKLIQADDGVKSWYNQIKNELKSYERVHDRMSWRRETYKVGRHAVARLAIKGKTLCLYLGVDPKNYSNSDYRVEDESEVSAFADTPCMYRIRSEQRLEYAFELIEDAMTAVGAEKGDNPATDYSLPYENLSSLIDKGLVKRIARN